MLPSGSLTEQCWYRRLGNGCCHTSCCDDHLWHLDRGPQPCTAAQGKFYGSCDSVTNPCQLAGQQAVLLCIHTGLIHHHVTVSGLPTSSSSVQSPLVVGHLSVPWLGSAHFVLARQSLARSICRFTGRAGWHGVMVSMGARMRSSPNGVMRMCLASSD